MREHQVKASELEVGDLISVEFQGKPVMVEVFNLADERSDGADVVVVRFEGPEGGFATRRVAPDTTITRIERD